MIDFDFSYSFSQIPYIDNNVLDEYAELVLKEYAPETLEKPMLVDIERLMEYGLELTVEYKKISYDRRVLGLTAFNTGYIQIYNEDTGEPQPLLIEEGSVIIDEGLLEKRNVPRMRFTLAHEASHWLLHRKVFSAENPFFQNDNYENQYIAAKEGRMDYCRCQYEKGDHTRGIHAHRGNDAGISLHCHISKEGK